MSRRKSELFRLKYNQFESLCRHFSTRKNLLKFVSFFTKTKTHHKNINYVTVWCWQTVGFMAMDVRHNSKFWFTSTFNLSSTMNENSIRQKKFHDRRVIILFA